jgi:hypothetical protein
MTRETISLLANWRQSDALFHMKDNALEPETLAATALLCVHADYKIL